MTDRAPTLDLAHGDRQLDEHLRRSLVILRDRHPAATTRTLIDDVLAGRRGLRETVRTPEFRELLDTPTTSSARAQTPPCSAGPTEPGGEEAERCDTDFGGRGGYTFLR